MHWFERGIYWQYLWLSWIGRKVLPVRCSDQHELYGYGSDVSGVRVLGFLDDDSPYPRPLAEVHLYPVLRPLRRPAPSALFSLTWYHYIKDNIIPLMVVWTYSRWKLKPVYHLWKKCIWGLFSFPLFLPWNTSVLIQFRIRLLTVNWSCDDFSESDWYILNRTFI